MALSRRDVHRLARRQVPRRSKKCHRKRALEDCETFGLAHMHIHGQGWRVRCHLFLENQVGRRQPYEGQRLSRRGDRMTGN